MRDTLLRQRTGQHTPVTSVELFFDLVFVVAVTQISHALLGHMTWLGALESAILLLAIWWAWIDTAWITNWLDPARLPVRVMLFALMGIGIVMTSSLPEAFGERGLAFALAYAVFQVGRTLFCLWAVRSDQPLFRNFQRITIWYVVSAAIWIAGGLAEGETRLILWLIAVSIDTLGPAAGFYVPFLGGSATMDWAIDGGHIAERSGLFVLIALGESVLVTVVGFTELEWTPEVVMAMTAGLVQAIAIWTIYFGEHADRARDAVIRSNDPGHLGRLAYTYVPIFLVAGIIVSAVGDELALAHPTGHMEMRVTLILLGGPALFLFGAALFKLAVFGTMSRPRLAGIVAIVALFPFASAMTAVWVTSTTSAILVLVASYELVWLSRHPEEPQATIAE